MMKTFFTYKLLIYYVSVFALSSLCIISLLKISDFSNFISQNDHNDVVFNRNNNLYKERVQYTTITQFTPKNIVNTNQPLYRQLTSSKLSFQFTTNDTFDKITNTLNTLNIEWQNLMQSIRQFFEKLNIEWQNLIQSIRQFFEKLI